MDPITAKHALKLIQNLRYYFVGDKAELLDAIDKIIAKVK